MNIPKNKGFTLIELLVVIAIIAILSGIVLANLSGPRQKARDTKRISDLAQIQLMLEQFFDRCNVYPAFPLSLESAQSTGGTCTGDIRVKTFISVLPTDPNGTSAYGYFPYSSVSFTGGKYIDYVLSASLEGTLPNDRFKTPSQITGGFWHNNTVPSCDGQNYCVTSK